MLVLTLFFLFFPLSPSSVSSPLHHHSPSCADGPCPADVPDGVTAQPLCALQSPQGDKFCAILCKPSEGFLRANHVDDLSGGECGPMTCTPIPQAAGMGICVYDSSDMEEYLEAVTMGATV